jgi:hypothetical protein
MDGLALKAIAEMISTYYVDPSIDSKGWVMR